MKVITLLPRTVKNTKILTLKYLDQIHFKRPEFLVLKAKSWKFYQPGTKKSIGKKIPKSLNANILSYIYFKNETESVTPF
jgi:hypothetical protein